MIHVPVQVRRRLRKTLPRILAYVPATKRPQFKRSVHNAVRIYLDIHRPRGVSNELRWLSDSIRNPKSNPVIVWGSISVHAQKIVRQLDWIIGELPDPSCVPVDDFRQALSVRVVRGGRWVNEKRQRRWKEEIVGTRGRGAPRKDDIDVLVAFLAAAYTAATGAPPTKSWSQQNRPTHFEIILRLVFRAIGLGRRSLRFSTIKGALDRHQAAVRSLVRSNYEHTTN